jgi:hypothetical protein
MSEANEIKIDRLGADKIRDLFEESFEEQVGNRNNMGDAEANIINEGGNFSVELIITGMAGSPSCDDFKNAKVEGAESIVIQQEGYPEFKFGLDAEKTVRLNTNDYLVVYNYEA